MEEFQIPRERIKIIRADAALQGRLERLTGCSIETSDSDNVVVVNGDDAYKEFLAKNILTAIGRGFDADTACLLAKDNYYFSYIDLRQLFNEKRLRQIKARIIGKNGKTKKYIESVTSVKMSVYGHTVGFIGTITEVKEAETAVHTIIDGSTHKLAYSRMEATHRRYKEGR